jgi:hypothetical protein|tara:strand:- start:210 stop:497 length:288 start_codon:yes stop_codon:yes gene_type:complete
MTNYNNKSDRLAIVLDIAKKLKNYKLKNGSTLNLYNHELCSFVEEYKKITNEYIKQDEDDIKDYKGTLLFEEINKNIEYILPAKKSTAPLFVIRY